MRSRRFEGFHLLLGQRALEGPANLLGIPFGSDRLLHVLLDADALKQAADHVEDLVVAELLADALELFEQGLHHPALAGLAGDEVDDIDRVVHLLVAVDAAHPLLEPRRVPGDVPVEQPPGKLHVEALTRRVGADHVQGAAFVGRLAEELDLDLTLAKVHAAVNSSDLAGEAQPFEPPDEIDERVAMLGEDDPLLVARLGVVEVLAQLLELRLIPLGVYLLRQAEEGAGPARAR